MRESIDEDFSPEYDHVDFIEGECSGHECDQYKVEEGEHPEDHTLKDPRGTVIRRTSSRSWPDIWQIHITDAVVGRRPETKHIVWFNSNRRSGR